MKRVALGFFLNDEKVSFFEKISPRKKKFERENYRDGVKKFLS